MHLCRPHRAQQVQRAKDIVVVVLGRLLHRLADVTARGEVHHGIDVPTGKCAGGIGGVLQIAFDQVCALHRIAVTGGKVVEHGDLMALTVQQLYHVRADIAGAAGNQYRTIHSLPSSFRCSKNSERIASAVVRCNA